MTWTREPWQVGPNEDYERGKRDALAVLDTFGPNHVVTFTEESHAVHHPLWCRPNLLDCPLVNALLTLDGPPVEPGVYYALDLTPSGHPGRYVATDSPDAPPVADEDGLPVRPWPANEEPAPEVLAAWLLTAPFSELVRFVAHAQEDAGAARNCFERGHNPAHGPGRSGGVRGHRPTRGRLNP